MLYYSQLLKVNKATMKNNLKDFYFKAREAMVVSQLQDRGITDPQVLEAFLKVPRECFFPKNLKEFAYDDGPFPIGEGQTISQPYIVALMTEYLELRGPQKVLEIGTGSGYQTAILAELAREVYTIERISRLTQKAEKILKALGYQNIKFFTADGTLGLPQHRPFERILVTAGATSIPPELTDQLTEGGILVIPIGQRGYQTLKIAKKIKGKIKIDQKDGCVFVPLVGEYGY